MSVAKGASNPCLSAPGCVALSVSVTAALHHTLSAARCCRPTAAGGLEDADATGRRGGYRQPRPLCGGTCCAIRAACSGGWSAAIAARHGLAGGSACAACGIRTAQARRAGAVGRARARHSSSGAVIGDGTVCLLAICAQGAGSSCRACRQADSQVGGGCLPGSAVSLARDCAHEERACISTAHWAAAGVAQPHSAAAPPRASTLADAASNRLRRRLHRSMIGIRRRRTTVSRAARPPSSARGRGRRRGRGCDSRMYAAIMVCDTAFGCHGTECRQ